MRRCERRFFVHRNVFCVDGSRLIREHRCKAPLFSLIVQEYNGHHADGLFARVTLRHFALQVLQKTIGEMIERTLAAGVFLIARAAVRTNEFHLVLLRIAVQSGPTGAAYANDFDNSPVHRIYPLEIHVHMHLMP